MKMTIAVLVAAGALTGCAEADPAGGGTGGDGMMAMAGAGGTGAAGASGTAGTTGAAGDGARGGQSGVGAAPARGGGSGSGAGGSTGTGNAGGSAMCPTGLNLIMCGTVCTDVRTDNANCGGCARSCTGTCSNGMCTCPSTINFEAGTNGAIVGAGSSAFVAVTNSNVATYCGSGSLAITAAYSGTAGSATKGEVVIPLPSAPIDLRNKTITVHLAADPCCADLGVFLAVNTQTGSILLSTSAIRLATGWITGTAMVTADKGVAAQSMELSLQVFSSTGYQGTIYVDEVNLK